ncbi:LL-diaminopimelate aminotransferase [Geosporobacter ferrireducens]|uniref:Aminotransferase n=1 Tax=Geosporobacter ferrireducens TaxID=1424294 RepID=A0A1D8GJL2_9FIRM|nr:LL-diaminopimelate aminotransferase [Geosporobacter ferrireducens]AOT71101.1 aspartate aminotransferase [Geosporobacter ferrireducens]MTI57905.1 LL-diaminopimelate aminotransferase [Geosporobacter ferrireducens]
MDFVQENIAERLGGINFEPSKKSYKFAKIKKMKAAVSAMYPHIPIIDLGIGEPDLPADSSIVNTLFQEAGKPENRWYADNGILPFQEAAGQFLEKFYAVHDIDPQREILHGIGSKPILAMLPLCFINPGDITLTTVPGYPVMGTYTQHLGGSIYPLPLYKENDFYPDFSKIPANILKKAKLLYINYPNNPTGQMATREFYETVVEFACRNRIIVVSDASYSAITFDETKPLSFLSIEGAKEVGVEIHSLSKAFNMTGWRLAFLAGNSRIIEAYGYIKAHTDSGQFIAIQKAGICALSQPEIIQKNCERYNRRHSLLVSVLKEVGFDVAKPKATFYCYVPIPKGTKSGICFKNAEEAAEYLLKKAFISTVPWDDAGSYLRLSVTFEANDYEEEKKIIEELRERLLKLELVF